MAEGPRVEGNSWLMSSGLWSNNVQINLEKCREARVTVQAEHKMISFANCRQISDILSYLNKILFVITQDNSIYNNKYTSIFSASHLSSKNGKF